MNLFFHHLSPPNALECFIKDGWLLHILSDSCISILWIWLSQSCWSSRLCRFFIDVLNLARFLFFWSLFCAPICHEFFSFGDLGELDAPLGSCNFLLHLSPPTFFLILASKSSESGRTSSGAHHVDALSNIIFLGVRPLVGSQHHPFSFIIIPHKDVLAFLSNFVRRWSGIKTAYATKYSEVTYNWFGPP